MMSEVKKRYCPSCLMFKLETDGKFIKTANKNIKRWACFSCLKKAEERRGKLC